MEHVTKIQEEKEGLDREENPGTPEQTEELELCP
jgi:hypothetical protein